MIIEVIGRTFFGLDFAAKLFSVAARPVTSLHCRVNMDRAEIEKVSKALADATRLRIFEAISASNQMNCGEIVSMRGVTPATVSHHLKILSEAGVVACRREGRFVYSQGVPGPIEGYYPARSTIISGRK